LEPNAVSAKLPTATIKTPDAQRNPHAAGFEFP